MIVSECNKISCSTRIFKNSKLKKHFYFTAFCTINTLSINERVQVKQTSNPAALSNKISEYAKSNCTFNVAIYRFLGGNTVCILQQTMILELVRSIFRFIYNISCKRKNLGCFGVIKYGERSIYSSSQYDSFRVQ